MIAHGEGAAGEGIEIFAERSRPHRQQSRLAQRSIEQDGAIHLHMPIFADHPYTRADSARGVEQRSASVIQFAGQTGHIAARGAEALRIVIQVRQIDERQIGPFALQYLGGAARDPLRAGQSRHRTPERGKGKRTEFAFEIVRQSRRRAGDAEHLVAVGPVIRFGRDADIDGGALIEPPEQLGTAKRLSRLAPRAAGR